MTDQNYSTYIAVDNSPSEVFNSLKEVAQWWSKDFEGNSSELNDEFIIHHPGQHYSKQRLIEVVPNEKIIWLVTESKLNWLKTDKEEWTGTKMIFEIATEGNKTVLRFTHDGLIPQQECYAMCRQGWDMIVKDWLLHFITTGKSSGGMNKAAEIRNRLLEK